MGKKIIIFFCFDGKKKKLQDTIFLGVGQKIDK